MKPTHLATLALATVLLPGCEAARKVDHAVASTLRPAVEALDRGTRTFARAVGSPLPGEDDDRDGARTRQAGRVDPEAVFTVPNRCIQDGRMKTDAPECALLNRALYENCVYRFDDGTAVWWDAKRWCADLHRQYDATYGAGANDAQARTKETQ